MAQAYKYVDDFFLYDSVRHHSNRLIHWTVYHTPWGPPLNPNTDLGESNLEPILLHVVSLSADRRRPIGGTYVDELDDLF